MRKLFCMIGVVAGILSVAPAHAAMRQVQHPNSLCDDYIRLKLQEYLDSNAAVTYDEYIAYKQDLVQFCDGALRDNTPILYERGSALRSFSRSLD